MYSLEFLFLPLIVPFWKEEISSQYIYKNERLNSFDPGRGRFVTFRSSYYKHYNPLGFINKACLLNPQCNFYLFKQPQNFIH